MASLDRHADLGNVAPVRSGAIVGDSATVDSPLDRTIDSTQFWRGPEQSKRQNHGARVSRKGSRKLQRGAAALEFAIVLPVLVLLLLGIVDFGVVMGAQTQISNAAREGARAGALTGVYTQAENAAKNAIASMPGATDSGTSVTITCTQTSGATCSLIDSTSDTGSTIKVSIAYVHTWISPVLLGMSPTITLHADSQMRIEA